MIEVKMTVESTSRDTNNGKHDRERQHQDRMATHPPMLSAVQ